MNTFFESFLQTEVTESKRALHTPSIFAKNTLFYVQETGILKSLKSHKCKREHLDSYLFLIVLSGKGVLSYGTQTYALTPSDCALIDCKNPYSHQSSEDDPWELMWVHFNGPLAASYYSYFTEQSSSVIFHTDNINEFSSIINQLILLQKEKESISEIVSSKLITDILTLCFTIPKQNEKATNNTIREKLSFVKDYIDVHFQEKLNLDQLADHFYISKYHLTREFRQHYGITIGNYIFSLRMTCAKEMLRFSNYSIEYIAESCGIPDTSYFNKVFRKSENMTASQYRKHWSQGR